MEKENNPQIEAVATKLADEIAYAHASIENLRNWGEAYRDLKSKLACMSMATRLMQAQAAAALSLQRLTVGNAHRFTFVHETPPPTPKKMKTNRRPATGSVEEVWEDEEYLGAPAGSHAEKSLG